MTRDEYVVVYRWSFRHPKTGKIVRPKNGRPFRMVIRRRVVPRKAKK